LTSSWETDGNSWLFVIDVQPAFSAPTSPWYTASLAVAKDRISELVEAFDGRALFSRFVPPEKAEGSWRTYYEKWHFALDPQNHAIWEVDAPWTDLPSVASPSFSKWIPEARAIIGTNADIVLCGVSTDCCVLATALAAIDDGYKVRVVEDACAAANPDVQRMSIDLMERRAPLIEITTTQIEIARVSVGLTSNILKGA